MHREKTNTTTLQRFGHVLGWTGNGIGALLILGGLSGLIYGTWSWYVWTPDVGKVSHVFRVTTPEGVLKRFEAVGTYDNAEDARKAVTKHLGLKVDYGPYGDWKVFSIDVQNSSQGHALEGAKTYARIEKSTRLRKENLDNGLLVAFLTIVPGMLILALGQALRYVFAGRRS